MCTLLLSLQQYFGQLILVHVSYYLWFSSSSYVCMNWVRKSRWLYFKESVLSQMFHISLMAMNRESKIRQRSSQIILKDPRQLRCCLVSTYCTFQGMVWCYLNILCKALLSDESVRTKFTDIILTSARHGFILWTSQALSSCVSTLISPYLGAQSLFIAIVDMHTVQLHATQQITEVVPMLVKLLHLHCYTSMICMAHSFITSSENKKE